MEGRWLPWKEQKQDIRPHPGLAWPVVMDNILRKPKMRQIRGARLQQLHDADSIPRAPATARIMRNEHGLQCMAPLPATEGTDQCIAHPRSGVSKTSESRSQGDNRSRNLFLTLNYTRELKKPLQRPPHGLEWRRHDDGSWELRKIRINKDTDGGVESAAYVEDENNTAPEFLEHPVMPEDTMTGICMRYKVKARELRQLNDFVGDHFRLCHTLIVPNRLAAVRKAPEPQTPDIILQRFRNMTYLGEAEAKFYLEESDWNLTKAMEEWNLDRKWEATKRGKAETPTQPYSPVKTSRSRRSAGQGTLPQIFPAIAGTINAQAYRVTDEGSIEMRPGEEHLAEARVPLLSADRPSHFRTRR